MRNQILIFSVIGMLLLNCTTTYLIQTRPESVFLQSTNPREGQIVLKNGEIWNGFNIQVAQDSTSWVPVVKFDPAGGRQPNIPRKIQTSTIRKITFRNQGRGAMVGFGAGALTGMSISLLFMMTSDTNGDVSPFFVGGVRTAIITPITGLIGMLFGLKSDKEEFIID